MFAENFDVPPNFCGIQTLFGTWKNAKGTHKSHRITYTHTSWRTVASDKRYLWDVDGKRDEQLKSSANVCEFGSEAATVRIERINKIATSCSVTHKRMDCTGCGMCKRARGMVIEMSGKGWGQRGGGENRQGKRSS